MLVYYTRIGGSQSADFYLVIQGAKLRDYGLRKSKISWLTIANSNEALECTKLVYSLRVRQFIHCLGFVFLLFFFCLFLSPWESHWGNSVEWTDEWGHCVPEVFWGSMYNGCPVFTEKDGEIIKLHTVGKIRQAWNAFGWHFVPFNKKKLYGSVPSGFC